MEDRESGSLGQKPALDLLVELHQGGVTGSLKLERAPLQKAVYFREGQILFAASNDPKDQLASILVEEGKLGPDQMQVAQARVSPGNPLAKVLTELGYISQRELADAARIKVEKILTDLYTWKEGTYQFATKSLPKGAIDLELSTARLLFASIRRVQDREWVLQQLGSLESVLTPTGDVESFIDQIQADPLAAEVLRLADGVKTVKQIGAVSSLGEFEVCKVLAAARVAGALGAGADPFAAGSSEDAFSFPPVPSSDPVVPPPPSVGVETVGLPAQESSEPDSMSYDTIYQAASPKLPEPTEESEKTVFEPAPMGIGTNPSFHAATEASAGELRRPPRTTELVIDEPEPATDEGLGRRAPRPKKLRAGGGSASGGSGGVVKLAGAAVLAGLAAFSVYYFVWPLVGASSPATSGTDPGVTTSSPPAVPSQGAGGSSTTGPRATGTSVGSSPSATAAPPTPAPEATTTSPPPPPLASTTPSPPTASAPTTTVAPRPAPAASGAPKPPPSPSVQTDGTGGRGLLRSGQLAAAARAFQQEIQASGSEKFTIALGLYCNEENVGRIVASADGSSDIMLLPTVVDGRSCYRVVWGLFDTRDQAVSSLGSVPSGVRAGDAAPVAISRFLR